MPFKNVSQVVSAFAMNVNNSRPKAWHKRAKLMYQNYI